MQGKDSSPAGNIRPRAPLSLPGAPWPARAALRSAHTSPSGARSACVGGRSATGGVASCTTESSMGRRSFALDLAAVQRGIFQPGGQRDLQRQNLGLRLIGAQRRVAEGPLAEETLKLASHIRPGQQICGGRAGRGGRRGPQRRSRQTLPAVRTGADRSLSPRGAAIEHGRLAVLTQACVPDADRAAAGMIEQFHSPSLRRDHRVSPTVRSARRACR